MNKNNTTKNGRIVKLPTVKGINMFYGTVDQNKLESIFCKFSSWVKFEDKKIFKHLGKNIRQYVHQHKNPLFKKEILTDVQISKKKDDKLHFLDIELTLFTEGVFTIKSEEVKKNIQALMLDILEKLLIDDRIRYNSKKINLTP